MAMNRIERNGRTYTAAWLDSDEHVIELFLAADRKRKELWTKAVSWTVALAISVGIWWILIWGVARAIDMARNY
jgi:hypothetical protein